MDIWTLSHFSIKKDVIKSEIYFFRQYDFNSNSTCVKKQWEILWSDSAAIPSF